MINIQSKVLASSIALGALIASPTLQAGDWGKAPVGKAPIEECLDLGGSLTTGYMSDFIFQGSRHAGDTVWTDAKYTIDSFYVPVTVGATYYNFTNGAFENGVFGDFLHTYASFNLGNLGNLGNLAGFDAALAYNHVFLPEGTGPINISSQGVVTLNLRRDLGFADLLLGTAYSSSGSGAGLTNFSGGWYHSGGLEKSFGITDDISLVLGVGVGYSDDYWVHFFNSGWAHYYATASLPIKLNCRTTLTPYIGFNGGMDNNAFGFASSDSLGTAGGGDVLHGGLNISISF
jgi:hypothetical protein